MAEFITTVERKNGKKNTWRCINIRLRRKIVSKEEHDKSIIGLGRGEWKIIKAY